MASGDGTDAWPKKENGNDSDARHDRCPPTYALDWAESMGVGGEREGREGREGPFWILLPPADVSRFGSRHSGRRENLGRAKRRWMVNVSPGRHDARKETYVWNFHVSVSISRPSFFIFLSYNVKCGNSPEATSSRRGILPKRVQLSKPPQDYPTR